jgi:cyanophycinase-like exopeptidase
MFVPGLVALLGSGETAPSSGVIYDTLVRGTDTPLQVAILETPAGFQPNSASVAGKIAEFLGVRLQNNKPAITLLPARKRNSPYDPDDPSITEPLRSAELVFLGPGSPTYAVQHLSGSLAWQRLLARHRQGARIATASAATIALSALALPVYEIYKVGSDIHWQAGLDFFGPYGLKLVFLPHWNNNEGGAELDTSRCFMGQERYAQLLALLPADHTLVGIDEHTGLLIDLASGQCRVLGKGGVTLVRDGQAQVFARNSQFAVSELGAVRMPEPYEGIPSAVWQAMLAQPAPQSAPNTAIPDEVLALVEARQGARTRRDWPAADAARMQLQVLGWQVRDTPDGPVVEPV